MLIFSYSAVAGREPARVTALVLVPPICTVIAILAWLFACVAPCGLDLILALHSSAQRRELDNPMAAVCVQLGAFRLFD